MVGRVISRFSKVDILVNNAGGLPSSPPIEDLSEEEWDKVLALNLKSNFLCCKAIVPYYERKEMWQDY